VVHSLNAYYPKVAFQLHSFTTEKKQIIIREKALNYIIHNKYLEKMGHSFIWDNEGKIIKHILNTFYDYPPQSPEFYQVFYQDNMNNLLVFTRVDFKKEWTNQEIVLSAFLNKIEFSFELIEVFDFIIRTNLEIENILKQKELESTEVQRRIFIIMVESFFDEDHMFSFYLIAILSIIKSIEVKTIQTNQLLDYAEKLVSFTLDFYRDYLNKILKIISKDLQLVMQRNNEIVNHEIKSVNEIPLNLINTAIHGVFSLLDKQRLDFIHDFSKERLKTYYYELAKLLDIDEKYFNTKKCIDFHQFSKDLLNEKF
jgi:hypothetical protein